MINAFDRLSGSVGKLLAIGLLTGICTTAVAHTALETSIPADGAVVASVSEQIQLRFTAAVALVRFSITDSADQQVKLDFTPSTESKNEYLMAVPALQAGNYKVDWAAIGADGHTVSNAFSFVVDPAAAAHAGHGDHGAGSHDDHHAADAGHGDAGHDH